MDEAFLIRPATKKDLDWIYAQSPYFGIGFTSLPHNKKVLQKRLHIAEQSFKEEIEPEERIYLFIRENLKSKEKIGIAGIDACVGYNKVFYNYHVSKVTQTNAALNKFITHTILNMVNNFQNASELISFWVHPNHRGHTVGKSLSFSRFLFMAQFPAYVKDDIIAEVRGYFDDNQISPFWEAIGRIFFDMDFQEADALTYADSKQFIDDLASREPIYADLLSKEAQRVIGVEHPTATGAVKVLKEQGFKYSNHIDIFDGGPVLHAHRNEIHAIMQSKLAVLAKIAPIVTVQEALLYNAKIDARFTVGAINIMNDHEIQLSEDIAHILNIKVGEQVRYYLI